MLWEDLLLASYVSFAVGKGGFAFLDSDEGSTLSYRAGYLVSLVWVSGKGVNNLCIYALLHATSLLRLSALISELCQIFPCHHCLQWDCRLFEATSALLELLRATGRGGSIISSHLILSHVLDVLMPLTQEGVKEALI